MKFHSNYLRPVGQHGRLRTPRVHSSEKNEGFLDVTFNTLHFLAENVEANSLRDGSALTNSHDITNLETECWGTVNGDSLVTLLKSIVLLDVVEEIATNDNSSMHLS